MRRREFIAGLGAVGLWPVAARAQQAGARVKRVAMIHPAMKPDDMRIGGDPTFATLFEEMKRLGYVEGVNLVVERYSPQGQFDRFPEIVREVVATRPDAILTMAAVSSVAALQSETRTIPIVAWTGDPVVGGIVSSLARPGGNVTGVSVDAGAEYGAKRLELLAEAVGRLSNVRLLSPPVQTPLVKTTIEAAEKLNIPLQREFLQTPINEAEYRRAFDEMKRDGVDGVVIGSDPENYTNRLLLGRLALEYRFPAICSFSDSVEAGALMSYAFDLKAGARRLAAQVVEILNGGKPADMPFF
jgi:putative tryptophan/tyrosine transport system substrate-binding protein